MWPHFTSSFFFRLDYDVSTGAIISDEGPLEERPVSPLELFFDLFFAALLSKLGHILSEHLGTHPGHVLFYYVIVFQLTYQNWLQVRRQHI
jgi:low temperature requirement protein LtrA